MILKGFKEESKKNYINFQLKNRIVKEINTKVGRVGVLFNNEELKQIPDFKSLAKILNTKEEAIEIIAFKSKLKEKEVIFNPTFTLKHLGWRGKIKDENLQRFLNTEFDLLLSYYKRDVTVLKLITVASKAKFKVGILETDERINDLIIKTELNDFKTFTSELKKYLNILNKI
ncbi:MAG: hypothetical protein QNK89_01435 [Lacinutrix sp.]|uniref:DUF6913 domain-containing protein n=1 Tax=Lacinutrix sp. TaxID=1937692 RepID=UPI0030A4C1FD